MNKKLNLTMIIISVLLFLGYILYIVFESLFTYNFIETIVGLTIILILYWPLILAAITTSSISFLYNSKQLKIFTLVLYCTMFITGFLVINNWILHVVGLIIAILDVVFHKDIENNENYRNKDINVTDSINQMNDETNANAIVLNTNDEINEFNTTEEVSVNTPVEEVRINTPSEDVSVNKKNEEINEFNTTEEVSVNTPVEDISVNTKNEDINNTSSNNNSEKDNYLEF